MVLWPTAALAAGCRRRLVARLLLLLQLLLLLHGVATQQLTPFQVRVCAGVCAAAGELLRTCMRCV